MENIYRNRYCGLISDNDINQTVRVAGWIENIRDHKVLSN